MRSAEEELDQVQLRYLGLLREAGCEFVFRTSFFGKSYVWMKDKYGTLFLESIPDDTAPVSVGPFTVEDFNA